MPATTATACGKLILLGEHAVVYDSPAIAIPLTSLRVRTTIEPAIGQPQGKIHIKAAMFGIDHEISELEKDHFLVQSLNLLFSFLGLHQRPTCRITLTSELPVAAGLGSSAAIAISLLRAMSAFLGHPLKPQELNTLAFQSEQAVHGRPSGIDNTVITYEKPVYYQRGEVIEFIEPIRAFTFVIADTGVRKSTRESTTQLAEALATNPDTIRPHLVAIADLVKQSKRSFQIGDIEALGKAIDANQEHLSALKLSCHELDMLILAARQAGALGAKLTGGGMGGHMLALVTPETEAAVTQALLSAGSPRVFTSHLHPGK
jgi:mevalonate kinase